MTDSTTIRSMQKLFAGPDGAASYGRVMMALHKAVLFDEDTKLEDPIEQVMYEQARVFAFKKAEAWFRQTDNMRNHNPRKKKDEAEAEDVQSYTTEPPEDF